MTVRRGKAPLLIALSLLLLLGAGVLWVLSMGRRRWDEMERKIEALRGELQAWEGRRESIAGPGTPGDAWTDYRQAIAATKLKYVDLTFLKGEPGADEGKVAAAIEVNAAALQTLRDGARRARADGRTLNENVDRLEYLGRLASSHALRLARAGRVSEALSLSLEILQAGRDVIESGVSRDLGVGSDILRSPLLILPEILRGLPKSELPRLDEFFGRFDGSLGLVGRVKKRALLRVGDAMRASEYAQGGFDLREGWRFAGSRRLMAASAFDYYAEMARRAETFENAPYDQVRGGGGYSDLSPMIRNNYAVLVGSRAGYSTIYESDLREIKARLRLLQTMVRVLLGQDPGEVPDPFGKTLRSAPIEGGLRIWSVGWNGADDGGTGDWMKDVSRDRVLDVLTK